MLILNDDARRHFDDLARKILKLTKPRPPAQRSQPEPVTRDEREVRVLSASDIIPESLRMSLVDFRGKRSGLFFQAGDTSYAVEDEAMELFEKLVALLCRQRHLRQAVGPRLLSDALEDWLKGQLEGAVTREFSDWLFSRANASLEARTVAVPIENFQSESPFDFAGVRFDHSVMTKDMFDKVERDWITAKPDLEAEIRSASRRHRRWFQGQTCGVVTREADPDWAATGAAEMVDRALSAIRLFSPSAFVPGYKSFVGRVGRVLVPGDVTCEVVDGLPACITNAAADGYAQTQWFWSDEDRRRAIRVGLEDFERLLLKDALTELEAAVLRAVELLDDSVCCNELEKRSALAFTAAESLLVRNTSEPVQVMLGLRCGHLTRQDPDDRMWVDRTIKEAYALRSGYLHRGRRKIDEKALSDLHCVLVDTLAAVSRLTPSLKTREKFFEHLDRLIWS